MQKWVCFSIAQQHKDTENARTIRRNLSAGSFGIGYLFGGNLLLFGKLSLALQNCFSILKLRMAFNNLNTVTEAKISHLKTKKMKRSRTLSEKKVGSVEAHARCIYRRKAKAAMEL